tara:strand:+ start:2416 stop:2856 length:441 start_codon:yes stop_codon:yes gene_type:complete
MSNNQKKLTVRESVDDAMSRQKPLVAKVSIHVGEDGASFRSIVFSGNPDNKDSVNIELKENGKTLFKGDIEEHEEYVKNGGILISEGGQVFGNASSNDDNRALFRLMENITKDLKERRSPESIVENAIGGGSQTISKKNGKKIKAR